MRDQLTLISRGKTLSQANSEVLAEIAAERLQIYNKLDPKLTRHTQFYVSVSGNIETARAAMLLDYPPATELTSGHLFGGPFGVIVDQLATQGFDLHSQLWVMDSLPCATTPQVLRAAKIHHRSKLWSDAHAIAAPAVTKALKRLPQQIGVRI